ncbi:MAG: hypothetical protein DHS20C01_26730 [marine bacterium B5-7]|nr:MAG: hypothetical protein DHS20C01_26730 [marine bacterium B5-7]
MSIALVVHLDIEPEHLNEFVDIVTRHGDYSLNNEEGCLSFTVIQNEEEANKLILVESYTDDAVLESHWSSEHMQAYRDKTNGMIRSRERYKGKIRLPA